MESSPSVFLTHRVNTCPGCSHDLLFCIGYANELFSSFLFFFPVILPRLCLPSCLSLSLHLRPSPQSPEWPLLGFRPFFSCVPLPVFLRLARCVVFSCNSVCFLKMTLIVVTFLIGCPGSANQSSRRKTERRNNGWICLHFHKIIKLSLIPWITAKVFDLTKEKYSHK